MALRKKITMPNGLELEYHRIALITIDVNNQITVLRHSYLNESARMYEKDYAAGLIEGEPTFPYVDYEYINFEYEDGVDIGQAYGYLKTLPQFDGAEDV